MKTVKILHSADLHIGAEESFLGAKSKERRFETLLTFEKAVNEAKKRGVRLFLMAGDLLDSNNIEKEFINGILDCINEAENIRFIYAAGNHDPLNCLSPFSVISKLPENLYVFPTNDYVLTFEDLNVKIYGKSFSEVFCSGEDRFSLTADEDYINILCVHGELDGEMSGNYNCIKREFIESSKMDYIALGHIHKRSEIRNINGTYFAYSGCIEGHGFDETGEKGVYIGEIGKSFCELEFIRTSKRLYLTEEVDITDLRDEKEVCEKILTDLAQKYDNFSNNLYKIILKGSYEEGKKLKSEEISVRLSEKLYFCKVTDNSCVSLDLKALSIENTLKGLFVKKMLEKIENSEDCEKESLQAALNIGLAAFDGEVSFDEDK